MTTLQASPPAARAAPNSPPSQPETAALTQSRYVERAGEITDKLIDLYTQLAFDKGSELRVRSETFQAAMADAKNVTTARELASLSAHNWAVEVIKTQGEIDGLILALQHCDRVLKNWSAV